MRLERGGPVPAEEPYGILWIARFTIMKKMSEFGTASLKLSALMDKAGQKQWVLDIRGAGESKKLGEMIVETKYVSVVTGNTNTSEM
jgi:hypothetical protein